jgi:hypothetical protein
MTNLSYFKDFYNNHKSYSSRREESSNFRKKYLEEIDEWKCKYLSELTNDITLNSLLEVGCAAGDVIGRWKIDTPMKNRYGVDLSTKNIEFAKSIYPEINFYPNILDEFLLNNDKLLLDCILFCDVIEHVEDDCGLLEKAGEKSKYVLLNLPLEKCWRTRNRNYGKDDVAGHLRAYDIKDCYQLIENAGLKVIKSIHAPYTKEPIFLRHLKEDLFDQEKLFQPIASLRFLRTALYSRLLPNLYGGTNFFGLLSKK